MIYREDLDRPLTVEEVDENFKELFEKNIFYVKTDDSGDKSIRASIIDYSNRNSEPYIGNNSIDLISVTQSTTEDMGVLGEYSLGFGDDNLVNGSYSFVNGEDNKNSGSYSFVNGRDNICSKSNSYVNGKDNIISADGSLITGSGNNVQGDNNYVSGLDNIVNRYNNIVKGRNNTINSKANIAIGEKNNSSYNFTFLQGTELKATAEDCFFKGKYNDFSDGSVVFGYGNGTSDADRSNLIELKSNGALHIDKMVETTANRPTLTKASSIPFFDTTLNKPIWYDGSVWVDAMGTEV